MSLNDYFLAALVAYGLPALCGVIVLAAIGLPLPATLLLIAAGSFVEQGTFDLWLVLGLASTAAITGDHIGYFIGRRGGRHLVLRLTRWAGGAARLHQAEAATRRWGGPGIFLSRWLFTPVGPAINLTSGIALYPLLYFTLFDVAGEVLWVCIYVTLGRLFSDRVQAMNNLLGDATWAILGLLAVLLIGWKLLQSFRSSRSRQAQLLSTEPAQRESSRDVRPQPVHED